MYLHADHTALSAHAVTWIVSTRVARRVAGAPLAVHTVLTRRWFYP